ncbi:MFS transporter [Flavimaricola marinus]|uniref:Major Facilitator Superfamily protein n=1 Tax=Flavimaricola marinus TaxID=1819565 RepID=A0A238LCN5_9RHOB|nr:MFS transporter [Flavimaricola marinus]SMY06696.1 Major Facilitator Superfamily protein [Flavimaricola marinus]
MFERRIPEWLRHAPAPSVRGFATLAGFEAITRGILISVFPVAMFDALGDAARISSIYFGIGIVSLLVGLLVPFLNRFVPRRWIFGIGNMGYVLGAVLGMFGTPATIIAALVLNSVATVSTFVCFNAYVLDYVARIELGKLETQRMFYSAAGWTVGPVVGVLLWSWWAPAPFLVAAVAATGQLAAFVYMRMGNGKLITRARRSAPNPLAFLGRFFAQPRLVAGWLFAVIRSCGWWAYVVYLPIYAVTRGLGENLGGAMLSTTNAALFLSPLILRWMQATSIKRSVRIGFFAAAGLFLTASLPGLPPAAAVAALFGGSLCLIVLDICAGLPFLMAVKPSERTEMSAIYSSYRDVSGIATPGIAWLVLLVAPITGIFAAAGTACLVAWGIAGRLHPRLGEARLRIVAPPLPAPEPGGEPAA